MTHFYFMNTNGLLNYYPENYEVEPVNFGQTILVQLEIRSLSIIMEMMAKAF